MEAKLTHTKTLSSSAETRTTGKNAYEDGFQAGFQAGYHQCLLTTQQALQRVTSPASVTFNPIKFRNDISLQN